MSNGDPTDWDSVIIEQASSPRRISVDGVDYQGRTLSELIAAKKDQNESGAVCRGFRGGIRQVASPPSALGVHRGVYGGRIW